MVYNDILNLFGIQEPSVLDTPYFNSSMLSLTKKLSVQKWRNKFLCLCIFTLQLKAYLVVYIKTRSRPHVSEQLCYHSPRGVTDVHCQVPGLSTSACPHRFTVL